MEEAGERVVESIEHDGPEQKAADGDAEQRTDQIKSYDAAPRAAAGAPARRSGVSVHACW